MGINKYLTDDGLKKIKEELEKRKDKVRKKIAKDIKEAKEQGDLSENAEYSAAKGREAENEKRIAELESILKNSVVVKKNKKSKKVAVGSTVKISDLNSKMKRIFFIVGSDEANPASNRISNESPIGAALMGKEAGDKVAVAVPGGKIEYKVEEVENN